MKKLVILFLTVISFGCNQQDDSASVAYQRELKQIQLELSRKASLLKNAAKEKSALDSELLELRSGFEKSKSEIASLRAEIDKLGARNSYLESTLKDRDSSIAEWKESFSRLSNEFKRVQSELEKEQARTRQLNATQSPKHGPKSPLSDVSVRMHGQDLILSFDLDAQRPTDEFIKKVGAFWLQPLEDDAAAGRDVSDEEIKKGYIYVRKWMINIHNTLVSIRDEIRSKNEYIQKSLRIEERVSKYFSACLYGNACEDAELGPSQITELIKKAQE